MSTTTSTVLNYDTLSTLSTTIGPDTPIFVLNVMRFKTTVSYAPDAPSSLTSLPTLSGRDAYYSRYIGALMPKMPPGAAPMFIGKPIKSILAAFPTSDAEDVDSVYVDGKHGVVEEDKDDRWDNVAIVKYARLQDFRDMVENEWYRKNAMPHRVASIEEYRLIVCEEMKLG